MTVAAFVTQGVGPGSTLALYVTSGLGIGEAVDPPEPPAPVVQDATGGWYLRPGRRADDERARIQAERVRLGIIEPPKREVLTLAKTKTPRTLDDEIRAELAASALLERLRPAPPVGEPAQSAAPMVDLARKLNRRKAAAILLLM